MIINTIHSALGRGAGHYTAGGSSSYQLAAGHWIPAKRSMTLCSPRPDADISSLISRQQYAYPDGVHQYRIPISIDGGSYPFYENTSYRSGFPTGMTIGSDPNSSDYMVITWTPNSGEQGNTYTPSTRIYDQDGNYLTISWSVTADTSKFVFLDPTAGTNGTGTKASPLNTFSDLSIVDGTGTSPYAGKIIVLRAGTTTFVGHESGSLGGAVITGDYLIWTGSGHSDNPYIFEGYTGETCIIDMNYSGAFRNYGQSDTWVSNITFKNAKQGVDENGGQLITTTWFDWAQNHRCIWMDNTYDNLQYYTGSGTDSNQAGVTAWLPSGFRNYWVFLNNRVTNSNLSLMDCFAVKYAVAEFNTFDTCTNFVTNGGLNVKADNQYWSIRRNYRTDNSFDMVDGLIRLANQADTYSCGPFDVCYNIDVPPANSRSCTPEDTNGAAWAPVYVYLYRNNFYGRVVQFDDKPDFHYWEKNVIVNDAGYYGAQCGVPQTTCVNLNVTLTSNITGTTSDNILDSSTGLITSAYESAHPGTRYTVGAEIG